MTTPMIGKGRKSDRSSLLRLALANAREERERAVMMERQLIRKKRREGKKKDKMFLPKLAFANAHEERERAEMMDGLLDCDLDPAECSEDWKGPSDDNLVDEDIDWKCE